MSAKVPDWIECALDLAKEAIAHAFEEAENDGMLEQAKREIYAYITENWGDFVRGERVMDNVVRPS